MYPNKQQVITKNVDAIICATIIKTKIPYKWGITKF